MSSRGWRITKVLTLRDRRSCDILERLEKPHTKYPEAGTLCVRPASNLGDLQDKVTGS